MSELGMPPEMFGMAQVPVCLLERICCIRYVSVAYVSASWSASVAYVPKQAL
jgi:hypothetical protein